MVIYTPVCIYNHGEFFFNISARKLFAEEQVAHFMLEKKHSASSGRLFALVHNIFLRKMTHGYMYAIRTYNHG